VWGAQSWEDLAPRARERVQLAQEDDGLDRQGDDVDTRIFMRSAGMRHSAALRSISDHAV
jgi:hypothetical protein